MLEARPFRPDPRTSAAFVAWFGRSRAVDQMGRPQIYYHGTVADFDAFDPERGQGAIFVTDNPVVAASYIGRMSTGHESDFESPSTWRAGGRVVPVYVKIERPLVKDAHGAPWHTLLHHGREHTTRTLVAHARRRGYDSILVRNVIDPGSWIPEKYRKSTIIAVFDPRQLKSTLNRGTWSSADPNMLGG